MKYILTCYSSQTSKNKAGSIRQLNPNEYNPADEQLILKNPNIRIICDCCLKNVTVICHIASDDYDYCVGCFSQLDQFPQQYIVRSTMLYSLTQPEWTCLDQILLLTAFQKWGFGNWGQVKDYMNFNGSKFSKIQIQQHYDQFYLQTHNLHPKVDSQIVARTRANSAQQAKRFTLQIPKKNENKPILQLKSQQMLSAGKKVTNATHCNILGYNPKRKCFYYDIEYDEKAQTMLADLEFQDNDSPEQIQLKFKIIENYNNRLDERLKRYKFTIDHHILDIDYRFKQEFSANKYQKQAFQVYRPFTRFLSHEKNQQAMELIAEGNHCKSLIQGLKMCRKKIDKEGKIQATLEYLNSKQDNAEKWGNPRKVYHIELDDPCETVSEELLKKFEFAIKKTDESETPHSLKVIYRSSNV